MRLPTNDIRTLAVVAVMLITLAMVTGGWYG